MERNAELSSLRNIALHIADTSSNLPAIPITGFMAMIGKHYKNDLMVVGRAVNCWTDGLKPQEFNERNKLESFLGNLYESVTAGQQCPMQWVSKSWENRDHDDYNTKK